MGSSAKVLAPADLRRLVALVGTRQDAVRDICIVLLSFRAGLRACEIAGLDWTMVVDAAGRVSDQLEVRASIAKNGHRRSLPAHPELKRALRNLHRRHRQPLSGPVICSRRGRAMSPKSVVNWFTALYREAGFPGCSSHSGRRTFITLSARLLAKAGGSLRDVQELAGHRALTTTERYIEGDRDAQRRLVRLL